MKQLILCLLGLLFITCESKREQTASVNLPLTIVKGYGPFRPAFAVLVNEENDDPEGKSWGKIHLSIKGIPKNWSNVNKSMVWLNAYQLVYQNVISKNITQEWYKSLQADGQWKPDKKKLSAKSIKCYVYVIWGIDDSGKWDVMVDTNNNRDFSDETPFSPELLDIDKKALNALSTQNVQLVNYEVYQHGQVLSSQIPIEIKRFKDNQLGYNFPRYAKAEIIQNGTKYKFAVLTQGLTTANFEKASIVDITDLKHGEFLEQSQFVDLGEYITLGGIFGKKYKNKGVDLFNNTLQLEGVATDTVIYSMQKGYPFQPFSAKEFSTKKSISLADYKGKYVYIDFWGTWCGGCVQDIPELVKMYKGIDKKRFEFVGIVGGDTPERLTKFIEKKGITWPQILSDDTNKLVEQYQVTGFPTTVLLDPTGKVIAKGLRGKGLELKLNELASKKL